MELTLDQALQKGIKAHRAGEVQKADCYYTAILKVNPKHPDANHNMGVLAVSIGRVEQALQFFMTALEANPNVAQFWLSYIDTLIKLNRITDAKAVLEEAKRKGPQGDSFQQIEKQLGSSSSQNSNTQVPSQEALQTLANLYSQGQYQKALNKGSQLLGQFPTSINLYNIIGAANNGLGKFDEAIKAYGKVLSINPNYAEAYNNIGVNFQEQGKLDKAIAAYNKALSIKPNYAEAYNNMGFNLQEQGKLEEAIQALEKALSIKPDYADAYINLGNALKDQGKLEKAIEAYKKVLAIKPDYADIYNNMGIVLKDQGKQGEAIENLKKALSLKPNYADAYNNLGVTLQDQGKFEEAIEAYNKAISLKPDYAEAHRNLSPIKKYTKEDNQFHQVQELYKQDGLSEDKRCHLSFALAKMYEDIGELDQSYRHLSTGNTLRKKLLKYSINQDQELFTKLKNTQPNLLKNSLEINENSVEPTPIFILGMPRSGTTLVEQIVSSHSDVTGTGELRFVEKYGAALATNAKSVNTASISEFREKYLSKLTKLSRGKQFVTDKMPQNFSFIPLICAAFPEAKIIHVERSAAATCWSNYKQYFRAKGLGYCYDLKDVVTYYELYRDLMKLWQSQHGDRIYNLNYESLTTNQENETKNLIKHLDLNWEEACLSPHLNKRSVRTASQKQVRQQVYQGSSEAWRKYEPYLNGVFDNLRSL